MSSEISISQKRNNGRTCDIIIFYSVLAFNIQIVCIHNWCKFNNVGLYRLFLGKKVFVVDRNLMGKGNFVVLWVLNHWFWQQNSCETPSHVDNMKISIYIWSLVLCKTLSLIIVIKTIAYIIAIKYKFINNNGDAPCF